MKTVEQAARELLDKLPAFGIIHVLQQPWKDGDLHLEAIAIGDEVKALEQALAFDTSTCDVDKPNMSAEDFHKATAKMFDTEHYLSYTKTPTEIYLECSVCGRDPGGCLKARQVFHLPFHYSLEQARDAFKEKLQELFDQEMQMIKTGAKESWKRNYEGPTQLNYDELKNVLDVYCE